MNLVKGLAAGDASSLDEGSDGKDGGSGELHVDEALMLRCKSKRL